MSLLEWAHGPLTSGEGGSAIKSERLVTYSGGLSPVRGREASCTPGLKLPPSGAADKGDFGNIQGLCKGAYRWLFSAIDLAVNL